MELKVKIRKKIAYSDQQVIVCGNDDYTVTFDWDAEWDALEPMMVVVCRDGSVYPPIGIENKRAKLPQLHTEECAIGLIAGETRTTTAAVYRCLPGVQDGASGEVELPESFYDVLLSKISIQNGTWYIGSADTGVAATGPQGPQGPQGETGATGPQGPQGATGATGPQGPQGETGPQGKSAYEVAKANGYEGTEAEWLEYWRGGPQGPQGEKGPQGETGATGPQGPQGETGPQGPKGDDAAVTAENISAALGYTPGQETFLITLKYVTDEEYEAQEEAVDILNAINQGRCIYIKWDNAIYPASYIETNSTGTWGDVRLFYSDDEQRMTISIECSASRNLTSFHMYTTPMCGIKINGTRYWPYDDDNVMVVFDDAINAMIDAKLEGLATTEYATWDGGEY